MPPKPARPNHGIVSTKLPPELDQLIRDHAEREGLSISELLRVIVHQWAYAGTPTVDEGYREARSQAVFLAKLVLERAAADMPTTLEEAQQLARTYGPGGG